MNTWSAACGSPAMFASATGETLPRWPFSPNAPPITTTAFTCSTSAGSCCSASARLVSGSTATMVNSPEWPRAIAAINCGAGSASSRRELAIGMPMLPIASAPCTSVGKRPGGLCNACAASRATGASMLKRSQSASAFAVVRSSGALPNTAAMPSSSARGSRASISRAIASSMPGSVSNRILVVMAGRVGLGRKGKSPAAVVGAASARAGTPARPGRLACRSGPRPIRPRSPSACSGRCACPCLR